MARFVEDLIVVRGDDLRELQNGWKQYYITVLDTIKAKGYYKPPRPLHPIRRWLLCQQHTMDYVISANLKYNACYIKPDVYYEVCSAYVTAFDEYVNSAPKTAFVIRKYLIDLLTMYVKSYHNLINLEPQRSVANNILNLVQKSV